MCLSLSRVSALCAASGLLVLGLVAAPDDSALDTYTRGSWWTRTDVPAWADFKKQPRSETVAFALYTTDRGVLKLSAQLYPLFPDETREVRLEIEEQGQWREIARSAAQEPGWTATFRVEPWDTNRDVRYRVRHGEAAEFAGLIRRAPRERDEIRIAFLTCNSNRDRGDRDSIVQNLRTLDPDLLFFSGDQVYDHTEHTASWLNWGRQFRESFRDRPAITIPDDHDVGQRNLWGEGGKACSTVDGDEGGYFCPAWYVNMVQRAQCAHLPDPVDPTPVDQGITVYFTRINIGGVDCAILEDRKFKTGPRGRVPKSETRPDHIVDPAFDPSSIDLPGLELLGPRQEQFLRTWGTDWTDATFKVVLSQSMFAGASHLHGADRMRLVADLDSNAWPQTARNRAVDLMRRAFALHLSGDQHIAVAGQYGIESPGDAGFAMMSPAVGNTVYARAWSPLEPPLPHGRIQPGILEHIGSYRDGLGNLLVAHAYANPGDAANLAEGFGLARFDRRTRRITLECWPRHGSIRDGTAGQYPGWPISLHLYDNYGRHPHGWLPTLSVGGRADPVVQVIRESDDEIVYTVRIQGNAFTPKVFAPGTYRVRVGYPETDTWQVIPGLTASSSTGAPPVQVRFGRE